MWNPAMENVISAPRSAKGRREFVGEPLVGSRKRERSGPSPTSSIKIILEGKALALPLININGNFWI
jgi:hypothetical protein